MIALSRTLALLGIVLCAVACKKPDESTAGANARSAAATATVTSGKLGLTAGPAPNAPKADKSVATMVRSRATRRTTA